VCPGEWGDNSEGGLMLSAVSYLIYQRMLVWKWH